MSLTDVLKKYENFDFNGFFSSITGEDVEKVLKKDKLSDMELLILLSPAAETKLEEMANRSHKKTAQYFGNTISLYIPLYISNFCSNGCIYCGFSAA